MPPSYSNSCGNSWGDGGDSASDSCHNPKNALLREVYRLLYHAYGPQGWWPGAGPFDVIIGAILTQAASWKNVELAIANLKAANCWSFAAIDQHSQEELAAIIRPSGYFNAKARKLKAFAAHVLEGYGGDLAGLFAQDTGPLRAELLSIYGIGPETADDILVYAAGQPSFVIDAYTIRILKRLGHIPAGDRGGYEDFQRLFHEQLPRDATLFNEYHALLDRHAGMACRKVPVCSGCCLREICSTGKAALPLAVRE